MNPFVIIFRAPFVMLEATWQILWMLVEAVLLGYALAKLLVVALMLAGRVVRNAYRRWF
uniref:hypothetical protein n=1 Tax=Sulfuriferula sp. GW6 TaxID=3345112 RepID=UPI0039F697B3